VGYCRGFIRINESGDNKMKITSKVAITILVAAFYICACGNDNNKASAQTATESSAPVQSKDTEKSPQAYRIVEKTYNGQTIQMLDVDDFPLRGVPMETIKEKAGKGDPAAQYELGRRLGKGEGVGRDIQQGIQWFEKAAQKDYPEAEFELANMYSLGLAVRQDQQQALHWYRKAAE
jgi:TPR repeat protein